MACIVGGRAASDKPMDGARRDMSEQSKKKRKTRRSKHGSDQEGDGDLSDEAGTGVYEFWIMVLLLIDEVAKISVLFISDHDACMQVCHVAVWA